MKWEIRKKFSCGEPYYGIYTRRGDNWYGYNLVYEYNAKELKQCGIKVMWLASNYVQLTNELVDTFEGTVEELVNYVEMLKLIED